MTIYHHLAWALKMGLFATYVEGNARGHRSFNLAQQVSIANAFVIMALEA